MIYQRPIFGGLAALYCLCLGALALYQNSKSKETRLFAFYNFSLGIWNLSDWIVFYPNPLYGLYHLRVFGIGGCFMVPFVLNFNYEIIGIAGRAIYSKIIKIMYALGFVLSFLHLTPWILKSVDYTHLQPENHFAEMGILYPLFGGFLLIGLALAVLPLIFEYKKSKGFRRQQITYVFIACSIGFVAICVFFGSFFGHDYPWIYYPCEVLVSLCFAYAIFKHDLISTKVAVRRATLMLGIIVVIFTLAAPLGYVFFKQVKSVEGMPLGSFILFQVLFASLFITAPIIYSFMVRRLNIFQEKTHSFLTHEMKSPLASIQSAQAIISDELLSKNPDPKRIKDYMDIIDRNTKRLEGFAGGFLDFNRIKEKMDPAEVEEINLKTIAEKVVADNPSLKDRITIEATGDLTLQGNKEGLKQIFTNLLSNTSKYAPGADVKILLRDYGSNIETILNDSGPGLEPADVAKIFNPYFRVEKGTNKAKGSGLGLAIVKKWIQYHNGQIRAESDGLGKGLRFIFSLPKKG